MIKCRILGHKRTKWVTPTIPLKTVNVSPAFDTCDRCNRIIGVWAWFNKHWSYFKR